MEEKLKKYSYLFSLYGLSEEILRTGKRLFVAENISEENEKVLAEALQTQISLLEKFIALIKK